MNDQLQEEINNLELNIKVREDQIEQLKKQQSWDNKRLKLAKDQLESLNTVKK